MQILLDVDDVILQNVEHFFALVEKEHGQKYDQDKFLNWGFHLTMTGMSREKIGECLQEMNHSADFEYLKPLPKSIETIKKLKTEGHQISLVSSCLPNDMPHLTEAMRMRQLKRLFGDDFFTEIHLIAMNPATLHGHGNKQEVLEQFSGDQTIFLDDSPKNHQHGLDAGIPNSFLFTRFWNSLEDSSCRINSWEEFHGKVQDISAKNHAIASSDREEVSALNND